MAERPLRLQIRDKRCPDAPRPANQRLLCSPRPGDGRSAGRSRPTPDIPRTDWMTRSDRARRRLPCRQRHAGTVGPPHESVGSRSSGPGIAGNAGSGTPPPPLRKRRRFSRYARHVDCFLEAGILAGPQRGASARILASDIEQSIARHSPADPLTPRAAPSAARPLPPADAGRRGATRHPRIVAPGAAAGLRQARSPRYCASSRN